MAVDAGLRRGVEAVLLLGAELRGELLVLAERDRQLRLHDGAGLRVGHRRQLPVLDDVVVAVGAAVRRDERGLVAAERGLRAAEHVPHVPREHGEEQDRDDRVQRAPRLELQDLRALTALTGEVLLDVVGHLADLAPDDLLARVELRDLGLDLGERLAVLDEVVDELAEVTGLALRHLVDGDVDVQRLFLEADHVMPREAADAHEHAEHEEDHAGREVREERHHRRVHDRRDQGEDRQVHVRADPAHGAARHDLLAERGALAERVERAGADEQQRGEDAEPDDHREHHAAGRVHVLLDVEEAPEPDREDDDRADDGRDVPLARCDLELRRTRHSAGPPKGRGWCVV